MTMRSKQYTRTSNTKAGGEFIKKQKCMTYRKKEQSGNVSLLF